MKVRAWCDGNYFPTSPKLRIELPTTNHLFQIQKSSMNLFYHIFDIKIYAVNNKKE